MNSSALPRVLLNSGLSYGLFRCSRQRQQANRTSRIKFDAAPQFNAEKFLTDPFLRAGFQNPTVFRRPADDWEKPRLARVQSTREKQRESYF